MRRTLLVSTPLWMALFVGAGQADEAAKRPTLAQQLSKPVTFSYDKTPLKEVIEDLKDKLNIPVVLHVKALEEAAINLERPITGTFKEGSALESINGLLRPIGLAAEPRYDVLFVTTVQAHSQFLFCRVYRLREVGDAGGVINQITSETAPASWNKVGGAGRIAKVGAGIIAISQTPTMHREIERKYGKKLLPVTVPAERIAALVPTKGPNPIAKMRDVLRRPLSVEYPETPLGEVVKDLNEKKRIKLAIDKKALLDASISIHTPVTVSLVDLPLESMLTLVLHDLGLAWTIDGEQILISTPEVAESRLITISYDARDLVPKEDYDSLIQSLTDTVRPESWDDVGGPGKITGKEAALSITQTVEVHRLIETWLADLRQAMQPVPARK